MLSFWEKEHFQSYDIGIVGAGIVGLSTAISIKEADKNLKVVILERGLLPTGASTKNAGFACVGSFTEIVDDLQHNSLDEVVGLMQMRYEGLAMLKGRLGEKNMDYQENGSHELLFGEAQVDLDIMAAVNEKTNAILGRKAFSVSHKKSVFGGGVKMLIENHLEGSLNTGLLMQSLINIALRLGVEIKTGYTVKSIKRTENGIHLVHSSLPLLVKKIAFCTNAFTSLILPDLIIAPGRGQVLVTKPLKKLSFQGIYHFDAGYYYFRNYKNRVIFGGGRSIDKAGEATTEFGINEKIQLDLKDKLARIILPNQAFEIDYYWSGIMAFGADKNPIVKKVGLHQFVAVKLGGMGIAIGSMVGAQLANMIIQDLNEDDLS
ncbi:FAD-binding oxidoreductase [Putridiphycobacter roseus]|uniref:FAD-binding oxidoreductase n=1 Tax=Putridiphycobacter roseus TaxID=2219161 RepID=A0A2W1MZC6_9FLAO|nr:FAD-dependent oxidoreductase [Putridiphycobacter roseus]PZE17267.1 FAD-binding oxidoreductase [Putridiphycobacter roseus]